MERYYISREETQDLFSLGKQLREHPNVMNKALSTVLTFISTSSPYLKPQQIRWIYDQCKFNKIETPEWLDTAIMDLLLAGK